jgi:branched-chain amino acid transport system substrate-binding protein
LITRAGGKVVGEEYFPLDQTDFTATVQKVLASKADLVFNTTIPPGVVSVYRQLSEAGFQRGGGRIACVYMDETFTGLIPAADLEGTVSCLDYYDALNDPIGNALKASFARESGGKVPFTAGTGATGMYRAIKLWQAGANAAKSLDPSKVSAAMDNLAPMQGPGGLFSVAPGTRHVRMPMYIATAKAGKFEIVQKSSGAVEPGECRS